MAVEIQMRRDTSADWISANPTLAQGEWGLETDTTYMKIGNGASTWTALPYEVYPYSSVTALISAASIAAINSSFLTTQAASVTLAASIAAIPGGGGGSVTSVFGRIGAVTASSVDYAAFYDANGKASAASTAAIASSFLTTQSASTAVVAMIPSSVVNKIEGLSGSVTFYSPNSSIIFNTSGASVGFTASVSSGASAGVASFNGRTGVVVPTTSDYNAASVGALSVFNVKDPLYGAVGNGTTDDTAAIQAAITAAIPTGGIVYLPQGKYKTSSTLTCNTDTSPYYPVFIQGAGIFNTTILPTSAVSGDALWMYNQNFYTAVNSGPGNFGGGITGLTIDGTNTTGASVCGLHFGDMFDAYVDVSVQNFTGASGIGVHFDNYYGWTERLRGSVFASSCTTGVVFDNNVARPGNSNGSFDRLDMNIQIDNNVATYDGVTFTNGAYCTDGSLTIGGNFQTSSSVLTSAVLRFTGASVSGDGSYSSLVNSRVNIGVEADGGLTHGPITIAMTGNNFMFGCYGVMDFLNPAFNTQTFAATNATNFSFDGFIYGDSTLNANNLLFGTVTANGTTAVNLTNQLVQTNSRIEFTLKTVGGTPGQMYVSTPAAPGLYYGDGTFSVKSSNVADSSTYSYRIVS